MTNQISFHVSLVVLVIDDYTGKPVTDGKACVFIEGQKAPIVKENGYYVFVNVYGERVTLICRSSMYQERTEEMNLAYREEMEPVIIRLLPAAGYPIPNGATCVAGRTCPGKRLLFWNEESRGYRLLSDYRAKDERIDIYAPNPKELEGKKVLIINKASDEKYCFRLIGKKEQQYRMDRKLPIDCKKTETIVIPMYEIVVDEKGGFFLLLPMHQGNDIRIFCQAEGEKVQSVALQSGKINTIIL